MGIRTAYEIGNTWVQVSNAKKCMITITTAVDNPQFYMNNVQSDDTALVETAEVGFQYKQTEDESTYIKSTKPLNVIVEVSA